MNCPHVGLQTANAILEKLATPSTMARAEMDSQTLSTMLSSRELGIPFLHES